MKILLTKALKTLDYNDFILVEKKLQKDFLSLEQLD